MLLYLTKGVSSDTQVINLVGVQASIFNPLSHNMACMLSVSAISY